MFKIIVQFLLIILYCLSSGAAESNANFFLKNLDNKSVDKKNSILKKRLKFDSNAKKQKFTLENVKYFLNLPQVNSANVDFVIKLSQRSGVKEFNSAVLQGVVAHCSRHFKKCFKGLLRNISCNGAELCEVKYGLILASSGAEGFDFLVENRAAFKSVLAYPFKKNENITGAYVKSIDFGFYRHAQAMSHQVHKVALSDPLVNYYKCKLMYLSGSTDRSEKCFLGLKGEWSDIGAAYAKFLGGKDYDKTKFKRAINKAMLSDYGSSVKSAIVFSGLLLQSVPESSKNLKIESNRDSYILGFMLLLIDKKIRFFSSQQRSQFVKDFSNNFPNSLLLRAYLGEESLEKLVIKLGLGKNHILSKVISNTLREI